MASIENEISSAFRCSRCNQHGAHVEQLSMSGTGVSRLFEARMIWAACSIFSSWISL
jgi:predicted nucleic-acid-binding Zn-ribbon protein